MKIKIRPVRWWRDDADRYKSRPPYVTPTYDGPTFEIIPMDPNIVTLMDSIREEQGRAYREMLTNWTTPTTDPVIDVRNFLRTLK